MHDISDHGREEVIIHVDSKLNLGEILEGGKDDVALNTGQLYGNAIVRHVGGGLIDVVLKRL